MTTQTLSILKLQQKINLFLVKNSTHRHRKQSPSINAMTAVLLIHEKIATTNTELAGALKKTQPSVKALLRSLSTGSTTGRTGFEFVGKTMGHNVVTGSARNEYYLTPKGKRFAKLIQPFFEC